MKRALPFFFLLLAALSANLLSARAEPATPQALADETEIRAAITAQTEAWNHADIPTFMQAYEDSPDTTFIGATLGKGYQPIRERYLRNYTTPEQMGKLTLHRPRYPSAPVWLRQIRDRSCDRQVPSRPDRQGRSEERRRHILPRLAQRPPRLEDHPRPHQLSRPNKKHN